MLLGEEFRRWLAGLHERLFAAAAADPGTVGEAMLREVVGDDGWAALPAPVKDDLHWRTARRSSPRSAAASSTSARSSSGRSTSRS